MACSWVSWLVVGRCGSVLSLSSAPGANAHSAEAQLPAYCRIDGRKDTRSGRSSPGPGRTAAQAAITMASQAGVMSGDAVAVPGGKAEEQEYRQVAEQDVPLQRHRQREGRGDEQVEHHHQHHAGDCEVAVRGEQQHQRRDDLDGRAACVRQAPRGEPATGGCRAGSPGRNARLNHFSRARTGCSTPSAGRRW